MAQQATAETGEYQGVPALSMLYEDQTLRVFKNSGGEIFVENKLDKRARIRVTPDQDWLIITAHEGVLTPWAVNGLSAFLVRGKRN